MFTRLTHENKHMYIKHLTELPDEDKYLRFSYNIKDHGIEGYVNNINFNRDLILGYFDINHNLVAAGHVAIINDIADIGISVSISHRGKGLGRLLWKRCILFAKIMGCKSITTQCLRYNTRMINIAKDAGMTLETNGLELFAIKDSKRLDLFDHYLFLNQIVSENIVVIETLLKTIKSLLSFDKENH